MGYNGIFKMDSGNRRRSAVDTFIYVQKMFCMRYESGKQACKEKEVNTFFFYFN